MSNSDENPKNDVAIEESRQQKDEKTDILCKTCSHLETSNVRLQKSEQQLKEKLAATQELADRYEKDLSGERLYRKDLEEKLMAFSLEVDAKVTKYKNRLNEFEDRLNVLIQKQENDMQDVEKLLKFAKSKVTDLEAALLNKQKKYEALSCLNSRKANEMREQNIELPQTVDQLQFLALQLREELIETKAAYEHEMNEHHDELSMAREQLLEMEIRIRENDELLEQQHERLMHHRQPELQKLIVLNKGTRQGTSPKQHSPTHITGTSSASSLETQRYKEIIADLERQVSVSQNDRANTEQALNDARQKCLTIQKELDTSEQVQKDFVRLSQNLQIQLEKIRQSENEIRWQFDEDIFQCNRCENNFGEKRPKLHCMHCGKLFCHECLLNTIPSGPNNRLARVCNVCHTLLNRFRDSIPFFSDEKQNSHFN